MSEIIKRRLRPAKVASELGVGLSTMWYYAKNDPTFPKFIKLSPGVSVIDGDELDAWVASKSAKVAA